MGTWGTALYSDDLAADLRREFRDLVGQGLSPSAVVNRLKTEYKSSLSDPDEGPVFWLAVADTGWRLGRLDDDARQNALRVIEADQDLARWETSTDRATRQRVLARLRAQLLSPPPAPKHIARPFRSTNDWQLGEIIGFQLLSGRWVLLRVVGHHQDKGGRAAVCELLDWTAESLPSTPDVDALSIRREAGPRGISQFLFPEARTKRDRIRIVRTGVVSRPAQKCGGYTAFVWPFVDRLFQEVFNLE
jgi:hypothetical protein